MYQFLRSKGRISLPTIFLVLLMLFVSLPLVLANPYPPYWNNGSGAAVHYPPVAWPADNVWMPYTRLGDSIDDQRTQDPSNGGTSPQNIANVSSNCPDQSQPSVAFYYNGGNVFFRWRVEAQPNTYAVGPSAGAYAATDPWNSAQWTVLIDTDGDGYREFAIHLNGSSGSPSAPIDELVSIYSNTNNQSIDYVGDSSVYKLYHNPTAFVDSQSDRILNFHNNLTPDALWPNGSAETIWDYGTTRSIKVTGSGCSEFIIDYQFPLAMLDASSVSGPKVTGSTPISFLFATANSLTNPFQKDIVLEGDYIGNPYAPAPFGDTVILDAGIIQQPRVNSVTTGTCSASSTLTASLADTITNTSLTTVSATNFYYYYDQNGDGQPNDGANTWTLAATGSTTNSPVGQWTGSWNPTALLSGKYLIGVEAVDTQAQNIDGKGHRTFSYLSAAQVSALTPPANELYYANTSPDPGVIYSSFTNSCGVTPTVTKTANVSSVTVGQPVTYTITVNNPTSVAMTVSQIDDTLPAGFTYVSTSGSSTLGSPSVAVSGSTVTWTFSPAASVPAGQSKTLIFTANASTTTGTYSNVATVTSSLGTYTSSAAQVGVGSPRLTISKAASVTSANPGAPITYSITYSNDSPISVTNAVITDVLPTNMTIGTVNNGGVYTSATRTLTWNVGNLASGEGPYTVSFTATVDSPYPSNGAASITNTATITSTQSSPASANVSTYINAPHPVLTIQKDATVNQVNPANSPAGSNQITFTISYANQGNAQATNVIITDVIPAGFTFVSATNSGTNTSGTVTWNIGTVNAGATGSVQLVLQVNTGYSGNNPTSNTASISSTQTSPVSDTFTIGITPGSCSTYYFHNETENVGTDGVKQLANATVTQTSDVGASIIISTSDTTNFAEVTRFYSPATNGSYTLSGNLTTYFWVDRQNGPGSVIQTTIYDYNPTNGSKTSLGTNQTTFNGSDKGLYQFTVPVSGTLQTGHRLLWIYEVKKSGGSGTVTLQFQYDGTASNLQTNDGSTSAALSRADVCLTPAAAPNLTIDKQVNNLLVSPAGSLQYTIRFTNSGTANSTSTTIVDTLPTGVTFTSATLNGSAVSAANVSGQAYTFNVNSSDTATSGQVTAGKSGTLIINATVNSQLDSGITQLTNTAALTSTQQPSAINDSISSTVQRPNVTISKSADKTLLVPGDTVTYTLTVTNSGAGTASSVTITDNLPDQTYFTYVAGSTKLDGVSIADSVTGSVPNQVLSYTIPSLAAGSSSSLSFQMKVAASGSPSGSTDLTNTATVSDAQTTGTRISDPTIVSITTNPNLRLTKTTTPASGPVQAGASFTYNLTISNIGGGDATNVVVEDPIPANTTYESGSLIFQSTAQTDDLDSDNGSFNIFGNKVVFNIPTLTAGSSQTISFNVLVNSPLAAGLTTLTNTATVSASNGASRQATVAINALAAPVLSISKTAPTQVVFPLAKLASNVISATTITVDNASYMSIADVISVNGTTATISGISGNQVALGSAVSGSTGDSVIPTYEYLLTYQVAGNASATTVVVQDVLPAGLAFISADHGGTFSSGTVTWNLGTLAVGSSGTLHVRVRPNAAGTFNNTASIGSTETTPVNSNTTSTQAGAIEVTKTTSTPLITNSANGTQATYTITVENRTAVTATNVTASDDLPPGFTYSSTSSVTQTAGVTRTTFTNPNSGNSQPQWLAWSIPAGGKVTITFVANVSLSLGSGTYQNFASSTSSNAAVMSFDAYSTTAEDVTITDLMPNAVDDNVTTNEDTPVNIHLLSNDYPGDVPLTLTVNNPSHGTFTVNDNGTPNNSVDDYVVYTPDANYYGSDSFTYQICDVDGDCKTATVNITIDPVDEPASAVDDSASTNEDTPVSIPVLANDSVPDGISLLTIDTTPSNGTVLVNDNGTSTDPSDDFIDYTPDINYNGSDSFTYTVCDSDTPTAQCATATVTVTVIAVDDLVTVSDDVALTPQDTPVDIHVLSNDDSGDGFGSLTVQTQPTHGTAVVNTNGTPADPSDDYIDYTPNAGYSGPDSFTYTLCDTDTPTPDCDTATVNITVGMTDYPVGAVDDTGTATEDTPLDVDVLSNDSAPNGVISLIVASVPAYGTAVVNDNGTPADPTDDYIVYTPDANYNGSDSFTYTVCDLDNDCDTATVNITVNATDDPVTATNDSATTNEDTPVNVTVLSNDSAPDGVGSIAVATTPTNGTASVNNNGTPADPTDDTIVYTPNANYNGSDSFTYTLCDVDGDCQNATVNVTINPVDDPVSASDDTTSTNEDTPVDVIVLTNDSAPDGVGSISVSNVPLHGTAVVNNNGTPADPTDDYIVYTPDVNYSGSDSFIYTVCDVDNDCDMATVNVTVNAIDDPVTATDDPASTNENTPVNVMALTNDSAPDGVGSITVATTPTSGTATVNNNGTPADASDDFIVYAPNANYNGSDSFTYTLCDVDGDCQTAAVTVTVGGIDDPVTATDDTTSTNEDTPVNMTVLPNDSAPDGVGSIVVATTPTNGTATVNDNGTPANPSDDYIVYTPNANYNGSDSFTYTLCDVDGDCQTATVSVTINPVDDAVTATNDSATTNEDTPVNVTVLPNDSAPDGVGSIVVATAPTNGTATVNNNGTPADANDDFIVYTPNANYNGSDSFTYTLCDADGDCQTATVSVTINSLPDTPTADDDTVNTAKNISLNIPVGTLLTGDVDPDGGSLVVTSVTAVSGGTVTLNDNGTPADPTDDYVAFVPTTNFVGSATFTYNVCNASSLCATANVTVIINGSPDAVDDTSTVSEDSQNNLIHVLSNDSDPENDPITITTVGTPSHGTAVINNNGTPADPTDDTISYTPVANYSGPDSFTYTICDTNNLCDTATVTITVQAVYNNVSGRVYNDLNGNGTNASTPDEGNSSGIVSVQVQLVDAGNNVVASIDTDANGYYTFSNVSDGTYTVRVNTADTDLTGLDPNIALTPGSNATVSVTVDSVNNVSIPEAYFPFRAPASLQLTKNGYDVNGTPLQSGDTIAWVICALNPDALPADNVTINDPFDTGKLTLVSGSIKAGVSASCPNSPAAASALGLSSVPDSNNISQNVGTVPATQYAVLYFETTLKNPTTWSGFGWIGGLLGLILLRPPSAKKQRRFNGRMGITTVFILVFSLFVAAAYAQDTPTDVPTDGSANQNPAPTDVPTAIPIPTDIPTLVPPPTDILVPTAVPTELSSPTSVPTEQPSLTPVPTESNQATSEPTVATTAIPTDVGTIAAEMTETLTPTVEVTPEVTAEQTIEAIIPTVVFAAPQAALSVPGFIISNSASASRSGYNGAVSTTASLSANLDFTLSPNNTNNGIPGTPIQYTHVLTNISDLADSYTIDFPAGSQGWPQSLSIYSGGSLLVKLNANTTGYSLPALQPGEFFTLIHEITVPPLIVTNGTSDLTVITANSAYSPVLNRIVSDTTTAQTACATGHIYNDTDQSGNWNQGDTTRAEFTNVVVEVIDINGILNAGAVLQTLTVNSNGTYTVNGLPAGQYRLHLNTNTLSPQPSLINPTIADQDVTVTVGNSCNQSDFGLAYFDPAVTKSGSVSTAAIGDSVTFNMTVTNTSSANILNARLDDPLPAYLDFVSAQTSQGTFSFASGTVSFSIGMMTPAQVVTMSVTTRVNSLAPNPGTVTNTAGLAYNGSLQTIVSSTASVQIQTAQATAVSSTNTPSPTPTPIPALVPTSAAVTNSIPAGYPSMLPVTGEQSRDSDISTLLLVVIVLAFVGVGLVGLLAVVVKLWLSRHMLFRFLRKHARPIVIVGLAIGIVIELVILLTLPIALEAPPVEVTEVAQMPTLMMQPTRIPTLIPQLPTAVPQLQPIPTLLVRPDDGTQNQNRQVSLKEWNTQFQPPDIPATHLVISKLGIDTDLVEAPIVGNTWDVSHFKDEIAHLDGTAFPGTGGNAVLAGHVTYVHGNGPFLHLNQLEVGDTILLTGTGVSYQYVVQFLKYVQPDEIEYTLPTKDSAVTLITCSNWDTNSQRYTQRLVVRAVRVV